MSWLGQQLDLSEAVAAVLKRQPRFAHLNPAQEAVLFLASAKQSEQPLLIVKRNETQARELEALIRELDPQIETVLYHQEESLRVEAISASLIQRIEKMGALWRISQHQPKLIITHVAALRRLIIDRTTYEHQILSLEAGMREEPIQLRRKLITMGYTHQEQVDRPLTFAMRGGVLDIYSVQEQRPVRIEFFDDEIEMIRSFDPQTQRTIKQIFRTTIAPANDWLLTAEDLQQIRTHAAQTLENNTKQMNESLIIQLHDNLEQDLIALSEGSSEPVFYPYLGYLENQTNIRSFIGDPLVIVTDQDQCEQQNQFLDEETQIYLMEEQAAGRQLFHLPIFMDRTQSLGTDPLIVASFEAAHAIDLPIHLYHPLPLSLIEQILLLQQQPNAMIVLATDEKRIEPLTETLNKANLPYRMFDTAQTEPGLYLELATRRHSLQIDQPLIYLLSDPQLAKQRIQGRYGQQFSESPSLNSLSDLHRGDYVVHKQYGIGRYEGIVTKEINSYHKDFLNIVYRNDDVLLVPLEQFSLVRKYVSKEAVTVRLSKLGTNEWNKTKERIRNNVRNIADQLIELYKAREQAKGFAFAPDTELQHEFEARFPYELTEDQKQAISEVKADMESAHPMDRLLCGDVGFGKTEVAIRAACKAVLNDKQVMFLCPTTILSDQHYRTFQARFTDFPINIAMLNRFVSDAQAKEIIRLFRQGGIDILIGTHRLLSRDVRPKDLGLLIIDEEQRFGVEHKEKIKSLKVNIDVLSLSATPIPRTLQMSLVGLRALSQLNTPPSNRLPVMTYVVEHNDRLIKEIIQRELARNGQVFYLYNKIDRIYTIAQAISQEIPDAQVAVVHGKMNREAIEDVMMDFVANKLNVLICTTIIETGIDIPNANTMIIDDAQNFGLAQLYQIKGRVGRSDRVAYAYLMVPVRRELSEVANKRLQAIKEFSQLGSGYKIAMRDLTIRGAGEILGGNQSGFIDSVGIDLYLELLQEAINMQASTEATQTEAKQENTNVNLRADAYIPGNFVDVEAQKIGLYQKIQSVQSPQGLAVLQKEMEDYYGKLPGAMLLLLEKRRLELFLEDPRIDAYKERLNRAEITFSEPYSQTINGYQLFKHVSELSRRIEIKYTNNRITLYFPQDDRDWLNQAIRLLSQIPVKEQKDAIR